MKGYRWQSCRKLALNRAFRQWTNGNLQFLLEPIGEGCRLRMKTVNANVRSGLVGGIVYMAIGFILATLFMLTDKAVPALIVIMLLMFMVAGIYFLRLR